MEGVAEFGGRKRSLGFGVQPSHPDHSMNSHFACFSIAALLALACPAEAAGELSEATAATMESLEAERLRDWQKACAPASDLQAKFKAALEKLEAGAKSAGNSKRALAAQAVLAELEEGESPNGQSADPEVAKAEKVFIEHMEKLKAQIRPALIKREEDHHSRLERLATQLEAKGLSDDASEIAERVESLAWEIREMKDFGNPAFKDGRRPGAMSSSVRIIKATYGHTGKTLDVTERIQQFVDDKAEFQVKPSHLGGDPQPHSNKPLRIIYEKDGKRREQNRGENEVILHESFVGPHDTKEMEAWLIGTRWEHDGDMYEFQEGGRLKSDAGGGEWKSDELFALKLKLPDGGFKSYRFDWLWKKLTAGDGGERVFTRQM